MAGPAFLPQKYSARTPPPPRKLAAGAHPPAPPQKNLGGEERNSGFPHRVRQLIVNGLTVGRDVLHWMPGIADDGNCGKDGNYEDGDRKQFRHDASPLRSDLPSSLVNLLQAAA